MAKKDDDAAADLPPEVLKQVNDARAEGGEEPIGVQDQDAEPEQVALPAPPVSRRAQKEQERQAELSAAQSAAEKATAVAEEMRAARAADQERFARMEALLQQQVSQRATTTTDNERTQPQDDLPGWYRKQVKKGEGELADGKIGDYHERMGRANQRLAAEVQQKQMDQLAQRMQQQRPADNGKPAWVSAIESQYPDVVIHPSGFNTVAAFAQMDASPLSPEKLQKAFNRAREELGLAKRGQETNEQKRQMLAGGRVNGGPAKGGGNGKADLMVNVPSNWRQVARANKMTDEQYLRNYAAMNPKDISRE